MSQSPVFWQLVKSLGVVDVSVCRECKPQGLDSTTASRDAKLNCVACGNTGKDKRPYFTCSEEEEMNQLSVGNFGNWSSQSGALKEFLQMERHLVKTRVKLVNKDKDLRRDEDFVYSFFEDLSLKNAGIVKIDKSLRRFSKLQELNLSRNKLKVLENIPRSLVVLNAYANEISSIRFDNGGIAPIIHMGLGYNQISDPNLLMPFCSTLVSLDLSFNNLVSLEEVISCLSKFPRLKYLWLAGNPLALAKSYRIALVYRLPGLESLDDVKCVREKPLSTPPPSAPVEADTKRPSSTHMSKPPPKGKKGKPVEIDEAAQQAELERQEAERIQMEKSRLASFAVTADALDTTLQLIVSAYKFCGLPDPSLKLDLSASATPVDSKDKKSAKDKKGGGKATRGDWEEGEKPGTWQKSSQEEPAKDEEGNTVSKETAIVKEFGYFIKYRLEGDSVYSSPAVPWVDDVETIELGHIHQLEISPTASWRDFLHLYGVDFLLCLRESTTTTITTKSSLSSVEATPRDAKEKGKKKNPKEAENENVQSETTSTTECQESFLGTFHVDLSTFLKASSKDQSVAVVEESFCEFVDLEDPEEWDPIAQRRIVTKKGNGAAATSSKAKRGSTVFDQTPAEEEIPSYRGMSFRISLNDVIAGPETPTKPEELAIRKKSVKKR